MHLHALEKKLASRDATIAVIGLGYVGLPLILLFEEQGFKTLGVDIDPKKVEFLQKGKSYIEHISSDSIKSAIDKGMEVTTDFSRISAADALILCVPTPLNRFKEPDLSYVTSTMESLQPYFKAGQVISLESTTYPGTTEEVLLPMVEENGLIVGDDIALVYSPEREDPGNENYTTHTIPKVIGGHTETCLSCGLALYKGVIEKVVPVSSTKVAEMTKLLENIHRAVNIGLVNEMKMVADKMGIDIYEVINAAASKPFGFVPYYPGPGIGGHCIPIDPFYLTWKAKEFGVNTQFIELSGVVNDNMPDWVIGKLSHALNKQKKPVNGSRILILGVAYKRNVDDNRESPSFVILDKLLELGAHVDYSDPYFPHIGRFRKYDFDKKSVELGPDTLSTYDAIVLATDHDAFDYDMLKTYGKLIIDCRGRFHTVRDTHIVHA